ncbi:MAG: HAMP domain-containing protein [Caldilineaceae bacterium]|nr:HAMP domain-containing protein [Caldilineaceae bacterium]
MAKLNPMRSLVWKLIFAFLGVGFVATLLMAAPIGWQTRNEFERFVMNRYGSTLVPALALYYERNGNWEGADALLLAVEQGRSADIVVEQTGVAQRLPTRRFVMLTLMDANGRPIYAIPPEQKGSFNTIGELPIVVNEKTVGRLLFRFPPLPAGSPEAEFLSRALRSILFGILVATFIALALSFFLARTLAQPIRALTAATRAMAQGAFGTQVDIRTRDELGELGQAFNQMSTELARSLHLRRQMTADIAHDLRTPLSVILGYTEALNDGKFVGDPAIYAILHEEANHLSRLIDDLRMLSLADAGELPLQRVPIAPRELLDRVAAAHRVQAEQQGVRVTVDASPNLPRVEVDPERIQQVLGNLVSNALRYTPAGGTIALRGDQVNGEVRLHVQDSGCGIDPVDLPFIFERFYRGDRARSQTGESGLGLPIAKSLIEMHQGTIAVASTLGKGTTFTILLPVAS